jgi:D-aspartate ligase
LNNPVIILGLSTPGIFLLRHFLKKGIKAYGLECNPKELGFKSRFGIKQVCPDPENNGEKFLEFILKMRKDFDVNPVLIPTADKFVLPLNDYADELSKYFYFTMPKDGVLRKLTSKRYCYELAVKYGYPAPKTCFVKDSSELENFVKDVEFPCILKPEFPESWRSGFLEEFCEGAKVIIVNSANELFSKYNVIKKYDDRVIVQEIIQGDDSNLHYFISYLDRNQNCIGSFTGIKERIAPVHFGSASYVDLVYNRELEEMTIKWLKDMKFWGISGVEVKKDIRDSKYKLIEVNPRFGLWDEIGNKFGIDVAMMSYNELLGKPLVPVKVTKTNIRWISIHRDIRASAEYVSKGIIPFHKILKSYFRFPIYVGDMRLNDLGLTFYLIKNLIKGILKRIFKKKKKNNV